MSEAEWFARLRRAVSRSQRDIAIIADEETPEDRKAIAELAQSLSLPAPDLEDDASIASTRKELVGIAYRFAQKELAR